MRQHRHLGVRGRRIGLGPLLGLTAAAAFVVFGVVPVSAQDGTRGPISNRDWEASFDQPGLNSGSFTATDAVVEGTGSFRTKMTLSPVLQELGFTATGPACEAATAGTSEVSETGPGGSTPARTFSVTVTSPCNQTVTLSVAATANPFGRKATMRTDIAFAVPATAVTSLSASVPGIDSREVTVAWEAPEGREMDTTYTVQRQAPGSDGWADVGSENELVDAVDDEAVGVYKYRVAASRPNVDDVHSAVVEVAVGVAPTTTTPDGDGDGDGSAGDGTSTTVTMPDAEAPITVPGRSTRIGNRGVSTHTTAGTAPRAPVTTIDTGFEETLDYHLDDIEPGELAAEGQSILSTDPETSVIGPGAIGASALVLMGWAGHYLYFRRLAAQF